MTNEELRSNLQILNGTINGCMEDLQQLEKFWPKSKRGSNAQFHLDSLKLRIEGAKNICAEIASSE